MTLEQYHDPETQARIDQFEMAFRMQAAVPELADLAMNPRSTFSSMDLNPKSQEPTPPTVSLLEGLLKEV